MKPLAASWGWLESRLAKIPESLVALLARLSIAAVFWQSGQTKIEGLVLGLTTGEFSLGWPQVGEGAIALFRDEYRLPLLSPEIAASLAAFAEHLLPLMLALGLGTRLAALGLLGMTAVIQFLVYPGAWPTHGTWAAVLLWLASRGPGRFSLDAGIARRFGPGLAPAGRTAGRPGG